MTGTMFTEEAMTGSRRDWGVAFCLAVGVHLAAAFWAQVSLPEGRPALIQLGRGEVLALALLEPSPPAGLPAEVSAPTVGSVPEPEPPSAEPELREEAPVPSSVEVPVPSPVEVLNVARVEVPAAPVAQPQGSGGATTAAETGGSDGAGVSGNVEGLSLASGIRIRYPEGARVRGEEGVTVLRVKVNARGRADDVKMEKSSGYPSLDKAAAAAARRAQFVPGMAGGKAIEGEAVLTFRFRLVD